MKFPKKGRLINLKLIKELKKQPCFICGIDFGIEIHHLQTVGSGGGDEKTNLLPLCRLDHSEIHAKGLRSIVKLHNLPISWEITGYPMRLDIPHEQEKFREKQKELLKNLKIESK